MRPARPEEFDEAGAVTALAYHEFVRPDDPGSWNEYLTRIADVGKRAARTVVLIAVDEGGAILGSATLELDGRTDPDDEPLEPGEAHIRMLGVHPDARRRGIAGLLMDGCTQRARAAGKTMITLNTTERMQAAQRMYEGMGFERRPDRVFPDGFVLLSYEKSLG